MRRTLLSLLAITVLGGWALAQQSPWGQPGSFLNGAPKPISFKPLNVPKGTQPVLPSTTPAKSGFLGNLYPKISLGGWPFKSSSSSTPTSTLPGVTAGK